MKRRLPFLFLASFFTAVPLASAGAHGEHGSLRSRSFEFTYAVDVPAVSGRGHELRIWVPLPQTSEHQTISELRIESPLPYQIYREPEYGNRYAFFRVLRVQLRSPFQIRIAFHAQRFEYRVNLEEDPPASSAALPPETARFLAPDRLVPVTGVIAGISRAQTRGVADPLEKARKLYDYVIATMHYDHAGTGWGRGDALWACDAKHGNCTDFHSLFIGLVRAAGIPAKFEIGFPLPTNRRDGKVSGYHCWAEFYIQGIGWIPLDASEAWLNPSKHDYFFGALDENRVQFTVGRDIRLDPPDNIGPTNYFIYPYAELDGRVFTGVKYAFSFRDDATSPARVSAKKR